MEFDCINYYNVDILLSTQLDCNYEIPIKY